jgi:hypothetical protein
MGEREGQGTAFESLASRLTIEKSTACVAANSFGVLYPKLLCGRSSLYSICQAAILRRDLALRVEQILKQLTRKLSSRSRP